MNTETMREMFEDSEEWKAWSNGLKKDCPEFAENYIQAIKNNVEKIVARAVAKEMEEIVEGLNILHRNSESRTSELQCSQEGYEYGLEDSITTIKYKTL